MACVVFPRIWHEIQQVGRPAYQRHDDEGERITMYNARQIESLRQRIIEEANKRDVRAIVVARANLLDDEALEWLLDLRSYRSREIGFAPRFALVLACTSSSDGSSPKIIHSLRKMHEIAAEWRQLKLGLIDEREAEAILGRLIYLNLYAQFEPLLDVNSIVAKLYDLTGGSWWLLRELALYIDEELGLAQSKERRQVTMDVLDRVYKRFEDNR